MATGDRTKLTQSGIYQIRCIVNEKVYIGSAANFSMRWSLHRGCLNKGIHHSRPLQNAWLKHGADSFAFEILEIAPPLDLVRVEQEYLDRVKPFGRRGYNVCRVAGSCLGIKHSPETVAKRAAANRGKRRTLEARANNAAAQR